LPPIAARHARPVRWIPIHVARLIESIGGRRPLDENPAFVRWYREDLMRWARRTGVSIRYHPDFPLRPARALRAATYAIEKGRGAAFATAVMRAYWSDNLDISDLRVIGVSPKVSGSAARTRSRPRWPRISRQGRSSHRGRDRGQRLRRSEFPR
jgi:2-hydroxychromene-2-carboxylate isomerase